MPTAVANKNSYAALVDAAAYLDASVNGVAWASVAQDTQARCLITATRSLDRQTWEGTRATLAIIASAAIAAGGSSYAKGAILTIQGGTTARPARVQVTAVSSGVVTGVLLIDAGLYTTAPSPLTGVATASSGAGTGCTLNLTTAAQALQMPRTGLTDRYGLDPGSTAVPAEFEQGCIELAFLMSQDPSLEQQGSTAQTTVKRVKAGSVEVENFSPGSFVPIQRFPPIVMELVGAYLANTASVIGSEGFGTDGESQFDDCDRDEFVEGLG